VDAKNAPDWLRGAANQEHNVLLHKMGGSQAVNHVFSVWFLRVSPWNKGLAKMAKSFYRWDHLLRLF
jgi:hypothetical protein